MPVFTDNFTDTNGEPWDGTKWTIDADGGEAADIQSNEGRMLGDGNAGWLTATANSDTDLQDLEVVLSLDPIHDETTTSTFDIFIRASGALDSGGVPTDGFFVGLFLDNDRNDTFALRREASSDTDFSQSANSRTGNAVKIWVKFQVEDVGSDTVFRSKIWDDGGGEPGSWDVEYTDTDPGTLHATTGKVYMRCGTTGGITFDNRFDAVEVTDLAASSGDYGRIIDLNTRETIRVVG
jgi:hypothetical protein